MTVQKITTIIAVILFSIGVFILVQEEYKPEPPIGKTFEYYIDNSPETKPVKQPTKQSVKQQETRTISSPTQQPSSIVQPREIDIRQLEKQVFDRINIIRKGNGLHELIWNEDLAIIAKNHSEDMAKRGYFSHYSPEGDGPRERGLKYGFEVCGDVDPNNYSWKTKYYYQKRVLNLGITDNLSFGSGYDVTNIPDIVVDGWLDSTGHRANLMQRMWHISGVGISIIDDSFYVTQTFC